MNKFLISATALAMASTSFMTSAKEKFNYNVDRFADIAVLRYQVPGFEDLSLRQKELVYYLNEAALQGRDILFDQNGKYNLAIRTTLEKIYTNFSGDKSSKDFKGLEKYLKLVWFANGIHHHYSMDKFTPEFSQSFFDAQVKKLGKFFRSHLSVCMRCVRLEELSQRKSQIRSIFLSFQNSSLLQMMQR